MTKIFDLMPRLMCSVEVCQRATIARGYCTKHYQRWKKYGDPMTTLLKVIEDREPQSPQLRRYCPRGHEYTEENTYRRPDNDHRACKECRTASAYAQGTVKRRIIKRNSMDRSEFGGNREKAILRDGERCIRCGINRDDHFDKFGKDLHVDHIRGRVSNSLDNLQTLCVRCHSSKDAPRRTHLARGII